MARAYAVSRLIVKKGVDGVYKQDESGRTPLTGALREFIGRLHWRRVQPHSRCHKGGRPVHAGRWLSCLRSPVAITGSPNTILARIRFLAHEIPDVRQQGHVAVPADLASWIAVVQLIANGTGRDRRRRHRWRAAAWSSGSAGRDDRRWSCLRERGRPALRSERLSLTLTLARAASPRSWRRTKTLPDQRA